MSSEPSDFLEIVYKNIAQYQFLSKAPFSDIFSMPARYLPIAVKELGEKTRELLKAQASMFLPIKTD